MQRPSCPAGIASIWLFYLHFLVHLPHALTQLSQTWVNLFSVWKISFNRQWWQSFYQWASNHSPYSKHVYQKKTNTLHKYFPTVFPLIPFTTICIIVTGHLFGEGQDLQPRFEVLWDWSAERAPSLPRADSPGQHSMMILLEVIWKKTFHLLFFLYHLLHFLLASFSAISILYNYTIMVTNEDVLTHFIMFKKLYVPTAPVPTWEQRSWRSSPPRRRSPPPARSCPCVALIITWSSVISWPTWSSGPRSSGSSWSACCACRWCCSQCSWSSRGRCSADRSSPALLD